MMLKHDAQTRWILWTINSLILAVIVVLIGIVVGHAKVLLIALGISMVSLLCLCVSIRYGLLDHDTN